MARRLRIQFPGALYHVINRGNYRADLFGSVGAADAFLQVLAEGADMFGWIVHAYVLMRNHFHLAIETPQPNLIEGMHWLQSTYATRFNRFRAENGHLFQGRYQSLLVENAAALVRVVDYIHLNPVRANIVPIEQVAAFRWSSLARCQRSDRPAWLTGAYWLLQLGLDESSEGWAAYVQRLNDLANQGDPKRDHDELCRGWAIGTSGWRRAIAEEHQHLALYPGLAAHEARELKHARWQSALDGILAKRGRSRELLRTARRGEDWKCEIAEMLRKTVGASPVWLAEHLEMGSPNSVRSWLSRRAGRNQQTSA